ncbi:glutathione S-transferase domain-containing protein [Pelagophyceae sp. CCMP2097]|nr:glutathione S-transferase domain-containing protein [Pelagophyceae sp. CCMP2097]
MAEYTLYSLEGSGNALKARLMLDFLGLQYDLVAPSAIHPADEAFLKLNPLGQVPVLVAADGPTICDSAAILVYLVLKHAPASHWHPSDPVVAANVTKWLAYAAHEVTDSLLWVRIKNKFEWDIPVAYEEALARSRATLAFLDAHLATVDWFANTAEPTIADVAVFPYVALAESSSDGALQLSDYPAVQRWVARFKALPKCHPMPPF